LKSRLIIILALVALIALPGPSNALNDERQGFMIGLGGGYGSARLSNDSDSESYSGLATTFKIGGGTSNQLLLYYSNRVIFFSENSLSFYQGMSAFGVSYFLEPQGPSFFFSGELGLGALDSFESGLSGDSGFGFTIGAGFEVSPHLVLEANYMRASVGDSPFDYAISNFTFAVAWLGY